MSTGHYDDRDPDKRRAAIARTVDLITAFNAEQHEAGEDEVARLLKDEPWMIVNVVAALAAICAGYVDANAELQGVTALDEMRRLESSLNGDTES